MLLDTFLMSILLLDCVGIENGNRHYATFAAACDLEEVATKESPRDLS